MSKAIVRNQVYQVFLIEHEHPINIALVSIDFDHSRYNFQKLLHPIGQKVDNKTKNVTNRMKSF